MKSLLTITAIFMLTSSVFAEELFNPTPMTQFNKFAGTHILNNKNPISKEEESPNTSIDDYRKKLNSINIEMQNLQNQNRELELAQKALIAGGDIAQASETNLRRIQLLSKYNKLLDIYAITNFDLGDNISLSNAMSRATGRQVGVQPLTNGNFNLVVNGQPVRSNISRADLKDTASSMLGLQ
jgi:hypothetical protein